MILILIFQQLQLENEQNIDFFGNHIENEQNRQQFFWFLVSTFIETDSQEPKIVLFYIPQLSTMVTILSGIPVTSSLGQALGTGDYNWKCTK